MRTIGRSPEWKRNVLSNTARRMLAPVQFAPGSRRVRVYAMDPGFVLDRIDIVPAGLVQNYGTP